jgi:hypothetical protein
MKTKCLLWLALAAPLMGAPLSVEAWNMPNSQHTIAGGSLPFTGRIFWSSFLESNEDAQGPEGIRFRGITCMDGADDACGIQLVNPMLLSPLTMRMTNFYFTCDNPEGCPAFEFTLVADFLITGYLDEIVETNFRIEGCTTAGVTPQRSNVSCDGAAPGNSLTMTYYFAFGSSDRNGNDYAEVSYGDINEPFVGLNGPFEITGRGKTLPMNERVLMVQQFRIGGLPYTDPDGNTALSNWSGSIYFPGSITGAILNTEIPGNEVPEPGTCLLAGLGLFAAGAFRRARGSLRGWARGPMPKSLRFWRGGTTVT